MNRNELKKLIMGPIATVPTPFDKKFNIDFGRMHELTGWWVANGIVKGRGVIKVAAAMGEGPMLRDTEWPYLLSTVTNAAGNDAAVVCGLHYKDTLRTIEDAKRAQDLGAIGLQISPPIFNHPTQSDILRHFNAISDAIDIGILIYHTHWLSGGLIHPETFRSMANFEQVVAIKWNAPEGVPYEVMKTFADTFNVIDNGGGPILCHKLGGRGFVNETFAAYQPHDLKVWDLMESHRYDEAQKLWDSVNNPVREFYAKVNRKSGGEGRVLKGMMAILGQPCGVSRPPSEPLNNEEMAELRQLLIGFGWPVAN